MCSGFSAVLMMMRMMNHDTETQHEMVLYRSAPTRMERITRVCQVQLGKYNKLKATEDKNK